MFLDPQYRTCFMSLFWRLEFEMTARCLENVYTPAVKGGKVS